MIEYGIEIQQEGAEYPLITLTSSSPFVVPEVGEDIFVAVGEDTTIPVGKKYRVIHREFWFIESTFHGERTSKAEVALFVEGDRASR